MEEALRFFRAYELWIYLFLGLWGLYFIRKFILAWDELREAVFGLERENAQGRLNRASGLLVLLLMIAVAEFILVTFVAPAFPAANAQSTPTLDLLASATITLPVLTPGTQASVELAGTQSAIIPSVACVASQVEIISPQNGQDVSGVVEVVGTASIPNFGFYKFEIKRPDEAVWLTIQAGNTAVIAGKLGDWDTSRLTPGEYSLGLVVVDNEANTSEPCTILLRVFRAPEPTAGP
ncbi:MAG: hypothetical protein A2Z16_02480 [Chloroflexi bacterium RBG_16_54_18]|nr:MAG: hypothetical protein A2Z16_02480 [Chloroflexi bacterium RBG_16_54_18]